ncbi:MAG: hypothetical protein KGL57_05590 [Burkholderiales bacterium]|nr:hypothetical protein [Burkholderiales bacterium]
MHRFFPPALSTTVRRLGVVAVSCLAVATLASCGGGTQAKKFSPDSLVVFGDEFSLVKANGAKYAINSLVTGATVAPPYSCALHPIWVQYFANSLGFSFSNECTDWPAQPRTAVMLANDPQDVSINLANPIDAASVASAATAVTNAGANAVLTTINNNLGRLNSTTLVTVSVGRADIVQAYQTYLASPDSATQASLVSMLDTLGKNFSAGLRPVVQSGARVMLVLSPNLGSSPLAKWDATNLARNEAAMAALSKAFNQGVELGASIAGFTGQQVSLVRLDQIADVIAANPSTYGLTNVDATACATPAAAAPLCMSDTSSLAATDADTTYMWSDATHVNTVVQGTMATLVYSAFTRNPF